MRPLHWTNTTSFGLRMCYLESLSVRRHKDIRTNATERSTTRVCSTLNHLSYYDRLMPLNRISRTNYSTGLSYIYIYIYKYMYKIF